MVRIRTPARLITNRAGIKRVVGLLYSAGMKRHVAYESTLERECFIWLEQWYRGTYVEQPETVDIYFQERWRAYTPDVEIRHRDERVFIQVKPDAMLKRDEVSKRLEAATQQLNAQGIGHVTYSEKTVSRTRMTNLEMLYRYVCRPFGDSVVEDVRTCLRERDSWTLEQAASKLREFGLPLAPMYQMMFFEEISCELEARITRRSNIRLAQ